MSLLSFLGFGNNKIKDALLRGAVIIDVRSPSEFDRGRIPGSVNIPADRIPINSERIKEMGVPIIFCCSSGDRSNKALQYMKQKGLSEGYNGGNWHRVQKIANKI